MTTVTLNDTKKYPLPTEWNELNVEQLTGIAPLLMGKQVSYEAAAQIVNMLCDFDPEEIASVKESRKGDEAYNFLAAEVYNKLLPATEWLFKEVRLTKNVMPTIQGFTRFRFLPGQILYGPSSNFENLTLAEWVDTEFCLQQWHETSEEVWLNRFVSILYRPAVKNPFWNGLQQPVMRSAYVQELNDFRAAQVAVQPAGIKMAVVLWYIGCRNQLHEDHAWLFKKKSSDSTTSATRTWLDVYHDMSGGKFGDFDKTGLVYFRIILRDLYNNYQKSKEQ